MTKITMFYDDTCAICRTEALHMQEKHADKINIVTVDSGLEALEQNGISRTDAMTYLCVQDTGGNILKGMDAVRLLYRTAGYRFAPVLSFPVVKQLANFIYPIFARNRYYMPDWLTRLLFGTVANTSSMDANQQEQKSCENGICKIPPHKR